jgi:hypothetical protein
MLDKDHNKNLHKDIFLNEPSTVNLENEIIFLLTAPIVKSGNEMDIWSLGWVQQPRVSHGGF